VIPERDRSDDRHTALHEFAEWLASELAGAVTGARSRQLGSLRYVVDVVTYVQGFAAPGGGRGTAAPPEHFVMSPGLASALRSIAHEDLDSPIAATDSLITELEPYEGEPFDRKPFGKGIGPQTVDPDADEEGQALERLDKAAARLIGVFRNAAADVLESATPSLETDSAGEKGNPQEADYLKPSEVAGKLGVKTEVVYSLIRSKELTAINVAKPGSSRPRYKISKEALREFERRRECPASPETGIFRWLG